MLLAFTTQGTRSTEHNVVKDHLWVRGSRVSQKFAYMSMQSTWVIIFVFQGAQFDFKEDWGEQLISKCCPVLVVYDMTTDEIKELEGVPEHISAGQVGWNTTLVLAIYRRSCTQQFNTSMRWQSQFDAKFNSGLKCVCYSYLWGNVKVIITF